MEEELEAQKAAKEAEVAAYKKLATLGMTDEFEEYQKMLITTLASKMILAFTTNKITNWEEFCMVKGEIIARLQPIQAVGEAPALARAIEEEIKNFYLPS